MQILPLHSEIEAYLRKRNLVAKFEKQKQLFEHNPFHRSLATELLEPRHLKIWSFRVDQKCRALFIFRGSDTIEILDVNNHYRWRKIWRRAYWHRMLPCLSYSDKSFMLYICQLSPKQNTKSFCKGKGKLRKNYTYSKKRSAERLMTFLLNHLH